MDLTVFLPILEQPIQKPTIHRRLLLRLGETEILNPPLILRLNRHQKEARLVEIQMDFDRTIQTTIGLEAVETQEVDRLVVLEAETPTLEEAANAPAEVVDLLLLQVVEEGEDNKLIFQHCFLNKVYHG